MSAHCDDFDREIEVLRRRFGPAGFKRILDITRKDEAKEVTLGMLKRLGLRALATDEGLRYLTTMRAA